MTDDAKQEAWGRYCSQLEALDVDPYSPDVPADDDRHEQVEAIIAEYEAATKAKPLPPGWEGHPPEEPMDTLAGLADWLRAQWGFALAMGMGGEQGEATALADATRAVRNAHRVLQWLEADDRPERPLPAESLDGAKKQIDELEQWVRQKDKSGWKPSPQKAKAASASKT
jgi:hypothetical protein